MRVMLESNRDRHGGRDGVRVHLSVSRNRYEQESEKKEKSFHDYSVKIEGTK